MALAQKGLRHIRVDDTDYAWTISVDSGWFVIVVALASGTGPRLEAHTRYDRHSGDPRPITPRGVAALIRAARAAGWAPDSPAANGPLGAHFQMRDVDGWLDGSKP